VIVAGSLVAAIAGYSILTLTSTVSETTTIQWPSGPNHPNVVLRCTGGLFISDHHCVPLCPSRYIPVGPEQGVNPICMSSDNQPVSVYDLAGLQVSPDNGKTVFLVIQTVPLTKVQITAAQNYNTNVWLSIFKPILDTFANATTVPRVTTEVATVGDTVSRFKIQRISVNNVEGNFTNPYPLCCRYQSRTIQVGDDVGLQCEGASEVLKSIDFKDQVAIFTLTLSPSPGSCPICLSGDTLIGTPNGQVNVKNLTVGMPVWTLDRFGKRVPATILEVRRTPVPAAAGIIHVVLADGRQVYASSGHPTGDGRSIGQLKTGDLLDNSIVVVAESVPYGQPYTYDLLPSGDTGFYWANGILLGSTLAPFQSNGGWVQILSSNPERLGSSTLVGATNK